MAYALSKLQERLAKMSVQRVSMLKLDPENIVGFRTASWLTGDKYWDMDFMSRLESLTVEEREKATITYTHYYGFAGGTYFQMSDYGDVDYLGIGLDRDANEMYCPPKVRDLIVGTFYQSPRGIRFKRWVKISEFEACIIRALVEERKIEVHRIKQAEDTRTLQNLQLAMFARLILNGDIEHFIALKQNLPGTEAENYSARCNADSRIHATLKDLAPELWTLYKERSYEEKLYSSYIAPPRPKTITDNITGVADSIGLVTPFDNLVL